MADSKVEPQQEPNHPQLENPLNDPNNTYQVPFSFANTVNYENLNHGMSKNGEWAVGFCDCCAEMDACCEAYWCRCATVPRQYYLLKNGKRGRDFLVLFLILWCPCAFFIFSYKVRNLTRLRYNIQGTTCGDYCSTYWCNLCALTQNLRQMTLMGEYPGGTCYSPPMQQPPQ